MNCAAIESRVDESSVPHDRLAFPPPTAERCARAETLAQMLRRGRGVSDHAFDEIYPRAIRDASAVHWTPVRVAVRAVELLALRDNERLLDVGAGAGKFCIIAAAMSRAAVCGVERCAELAIVAREAAHRMKVDVAIVEGSFEASLAGAFDAAYFFNPFAAAVLLPGTQTFAADRDARRVADDVAIAEDFFARSRVGMRIVTFCGFGGVVPAGFERRAREPLDGGWLELWNKSA